jgi:hypothetical protein
LRDVADVVLGTGFIDVENGERLQVLDRPKQIDQRTPYRSIAHAITMSNLRRLASFST